MSKRDYPAHPLVGVGVVVRRGEQVLLIQRGRAPGAGRWSLPGGQLELGERLADAASREVLEETGVRVATPVLLTVFDYIERDEAGLLRFHYVLIDFVADWLAGEPRAGDDALDARFVDLRELDTFELWKETRQAIVQAFAQA